MKYVYAVSRFQAFAPKQASAVLPQHFSFREEDGRLLLVVEPPSNLTDEQVFGQVQQESDRHFFLTGEQLDPKPVRKEYPDGSVIGLASLSEDAYLIKPLPPEIDRQQWQIPLAVQLRLWQLAKLPDLPVAARINLLFQIIETRYPDQNDYPEYKDPKAPPHPRTEAKLLRHLASHGNTQTVTSKQLKLYCQHLGISEEFHNPTDADFIRVLRNRLSVVEREARKVIEASITRKP